MQKSKEINGLFLKKSKEINLKSSNQLLSNLSQQSKNLDPRPEPYVTYF